MAVTTLRGVGVGVPVVRTRAVARTLRYRAVAMFRGTGVLVTTIHSTGPSPGVAVTRLCGVGVAVPVVAASAVALAPMAAAVRTFSGVGVLVTTMCVAVQVAVTKLDGGGVAVPVVRAWAVARLARC